MAYKGGESAHGNGYEAEKRNDEDEEGCQEYFSSGSKNESIAKNRTANPTDTSGRNNDEESGEAAGKQHKGTHGE